MAIGSPLFYYDVFSPYAWMSAERIDGLVPGADWRPIQNWRLLKLTGRPPWVFTDERAGRMKEIEERAAAYGLPPVRWPTAIPEDLPRLATGATAARRKGCAQPFALGVMRAIYVDGIDATAPGELARIAAEVGLDAGRFERVMAEPETEAQLTAEIEEAHRLGVPGVPTVVLDGEIFWGDDRLDEAAQHLSGSSARG